jgi:exodeoxyribonuclease V alpha subunit
MTVFGKNKDYTFIKCEDKDIVKNTLGLYKKLLSKEWQESKGLSLDVSDIQILTAKNVGVYGTVALNNELQKIANKNYGSTKYFKVGDVVFYEGDLVMQQQNNYKAEVYADDMVLDDPFSDYGEPLKTLIANGETAVIKEINSQLQYVILDFCGTEVRYYRNDMQNISLGYAITGHKSQGSGIKIPIIVEPRSHIFMDTSNLLYVMLTRTKLMCFHLGLPETVNMVIKKKENLKRNTFMLEFLKLIKTTRKEQ